MSPMELKMQPTIHLKRKAGYGHGKYLALPSKCIVRCIFNSVGLIITRESPCVFVKTLLSFQTFTCAKIKRTYNGGKIVRSNIQKYKILYSSFFL
jgi:hypothetical protein